MKLRLEGPMDPCAIRSHGTKLIMLGRKLPSGTFKTKEGRANTNSFVLKDSVRNLRPSIINSVRCN